MYKEFSQNFSMIKNYLFNSSKAFQKTLIISLTLFYFAGCSSSSELLDKIAQMEVPLFEVPADLKDCDLREKRIDKYSEVLSDVKIFIDPGHGGEDRHKKSPSGELTEADANLRVALSLRDYLVEAGAKVIMSRDDDSTVELHERSVLANNSGADLFISIHHNAPGGNNRSVNYTSTFYHAKKENYEYEPCNHDIARYVQRDMAYAMRNSGGLGSFDGTYSDYWIYPGDGFSVLRRTEIPAVLVECSFFTNPVEEVRLQIEQFNEIEAWGIFKGLGKYFLTGVPKIEWNKKESNFIENRNDLVFNLIDENDIDDYSIKCFVDSNEVGFRFFEEENVLNINLENIVSGETTLRIICANKKGNYAFPYHKKIVIDENKKITLQ